MYRSTHVLIFSVVPQAHSQLLACNGLGDWDSNSKVDTIIVMSEIHNNLLYDTHTTSTKSRIQQCDINFTGSGPNHITASLFLVEDKL